MSENKKIIAPSGIDARTELFIRAARSARGAALTAGSLTNHNKYWQPEQHGADSAWLSSHPDFIRSRSRDLCDNDPLIYTAQRGAVNHEIRTGVPTQFNFDIIKDDQDRNDENNEAWERMHRTWANRFAHAQGLYSYWMMQRVIKDTLFSDGGIFIRRTLDDSEPAVCPLRLTLYEVDHLDSTFDGLQKDGNIAIRGMLFSLDGKWLGAYLLPYHPKSGWLAVGQQSSFISSDDLIYVFEPRRASQRLGRPATLPIAQLAHDLRSYQDIAMQKARFELSRGGWLKNAPPGTTLPAGIGEGLGTPSAGPSDYPTRLKESGVSGPTEVLVGGLQLGMLPEGTEWKEGKQLTPGPTHKEFVDLGGRRIGMAAGTGDLVATGNYTDYTFAGARSAALDAAVGFVCNQFVLDEQCFAKIDEWFIDACWLSGIDPGPGLPDYLVSPWEYYDRTTRQFPGERSMNRKQDMDAAETAVRNNFSSALKEAAVEGNDYHENVAENIRAVRADRKLLEEKLKNAEIEAKIKKLEAGNFE